MKVIHQFLSNQLPAVLRKIIEALLAFLILSMLVMVFGNVVLRYAFVSVQSSHLDALGF